MIACEFLKDGQCGVATDIAGYEADANESACEACLKLSCAKKENRVTVSLAIGAAAAAGDQAKVKMLAKEHHKKLKTPQIKKVRKKPKHEFNGWGAGTQLKRILSGMGINPSGSCACLGAAKEMDTRGPEWCWINRDWIAGVMKREASARGWPLANTPLAKVAAFRLVNLAIRRAEREGKKLGVYSPRMEEASEGGEGPLQGDQERPQEGGGGKGGPTGEG